jgi:hypothetical protein
LTVYEEIMLLEETPQLLTESELADILRISVAALRKWRVIGRGPQFIKIGPLVRYRAGDVQVWLESRPGGGEQRRAAVVPR